jgi:threonyl-tRNA synthetase
MNTSISILKDLGYSQEQAIKEFALLNTSQKIAELEQENEFFQRKYNSQFVEFEKKMKSRNEEIFSEEDDYLEWKFVVEGIQYWKSKVNELRRAA